MKKYVSKIKGGAVAAVALTMSFSAMADINVGALYPFSGGLALLGNESFRGLEIAIEERNANGGLRGEQIKLVKSDAVDAGQAVGAARKLTSIEGVDVIFGSFSSSISFAATQVAELAAVPYFELGAISDNITDRNMKYVFRSNPTAKNFAEGTIDAIFKVVAPTYGVDAKDLKVAIIHEDALYGTTVSQFQKEIAKEKGLNVVQTLPYSAKAVDLSSLVLRLKGAGADVVLQTSYQNDTTLFFRQIREAGYKPKALIGAGGGYSMKDTVKVVGEKNMEGVLDVDFAQYLMNEAGAPGIKEFQAKYKERYGEEPRSGHSLINYSGAKIFLDALEKAASLEGDDVREAVMAIDLPVGSTAAGIGAKMNENGQNTRANAAIMQWQGGELKTVYPEAAAVAAPKFPQHP